MLYASFLWPSAELLTRLVRCAQGGSTRSRDELLEILRPSLLTFFQRRLSVDAAEDLAQLALIRINGAISRIDPERADSYISTVARNVLRTAYRANARERARFDDHDASMILAEGEPADVRLEREEMVRAVHRACLTKVQPPLREVAVRVLDGRSGNEIAAELSISPVTVRTRMMKVRAILRREAAAYLVDSSAAPNVAADL